MSAIVIAGCGYIGERLARSYAESGRALTCLVRSPEHAERLVAEGYSTHVVSCDSLPDQAPFETGEATLFYCVPPPGGGIRDSRARNFIDLLRRNGTPKKIIYMSATSVYSETNGGVVSERSPAEPASATGKRRLDAENAFLAYGAEKGASIVILRVSGIYGPGRLPLMQISHGQPLLKEEESGMSNRIHADDLVAVCAAAAEKGETGDVFNISDGHPSSMTSYFNLCADQLGYPRQPQVSREEAYQVMSPLMLSYVTESKIVDSTRMLQTLGVQLMYPDMATGVPAACRESNFSQR